MKNDFKIKKIIVYIIAICIMILILFFLHNKSNAPGNGIVWSEQIETPKKKTSYIAIPGFSEVYFKSNSICQDFSFHNPKENNCYMNIQLKMPDGETLFQTDHINPGYGIKSIQLEHLLENGKYKNCTLSIKCFSMVDNTELNGVDLSIRIVVR